MQYFLNQFIAFRKDTEDSIREFEKENKIEAPKPIAKQYGTDDAIDWTALGHVGKVKNQGI